MLLSEKETGAFRQIFNRHFGLPLPEVEVTERANRLVLLVGLIYSGQIDEAVTFFRNKKGVNKYDR